MKKLKNFIAISLLVTSMQIFSSEALADELKSFQDEQATLTVRSDLMQIAPEIEDQIIADEADLEATFASIKRFVDKKSKQIEKMLQDKENDEILISKLAIELADAQAAFEKAKARQQAKHKKKSKLEQSIADILMKSEQGLKTLSARIKQAFEQVKEVVKEKVKKNKNKKQKSSQSAIAKNLKNSEDVIVKESKNASKKIKETFFAPSQKFN